MNAILKITEATGRSWEVQLDQNKNYLIGRAKNNDVILNDRRVSRQHATIRGEGSRFVLVDGYYENGSINRSANKVYINTVEILEQVLNPGDEITIGTSTLKFNLVTDTQAAVIPSTAETPMPFHGSIAPGHEIGITEVEKDLSYDDKPLGNTQFVISANEIIEKSAKTSMKGDFVPSDRLKQPSSDELKELRRKAQILEMLYEMSKTLGTVFDLKEIFNRATELIFRVTPAERVVALLADETVDGKILEYSLYPIAAKARDGSGDNLAEKLSISRTITQKVMREKVALLSQDAKKDAQFSGAESIVAQGVRSTICAPLVTESNVHGVVYADRLDPFSAFTQDDLELISAVAAQTAVTVETIKAHKRLAREEVARANYSRFMPEYVVKELLEKPDSFKLGGVNQTITVLFADIRGFTAFSEDQNPDRVVGLLNNYFSAMSEIIFENGGTLDKYIGDGLMALFGAPTASPKDADNAVKTAIAMQKRVQTLNQELKPQGYPPVSIGIGLHTGIATIGYIGSERRSEYTAIGDTVNLASRLESNAVGGQILISEATGKACEETFQIRKCEPLKVKNRLEPVSLFEVKWN
ncbi:MAG: adenylate/guanylate cyclase domain-containing protein [Pyrinomonadaceae bacterium]